jgi:hypothetical protein
MDTQQRRARTEEVAQGVETGVVVSRVKQAEFCVMRAV